MDARTPGEAIPANFVGGRGHFFGLVVRGSLLQIPTFGFYRFWLLTDIRRHLWSNTRIGTESLEYTGRGRELLIGFLIALAILAPIYLLFFWLSLEAERLQAFASVPLLLLLYFLGQYGSYRARRYRATRTIFRGLRLSMTGSGWSYAARALLWDALTVVTVGIAYPWRAAALERYRMHHTFYGDLPGGFVGTGWTFFKRGWWLWLIMVFTVLATFALSVAAYLASAMSSTAGLSAGATTVPTFLAFVVLYLVIWPMFRAIQLRWRLGGIRFGEAALASTLTKGAIFKCYAKAWLAGLAFFIVTAILIGVLVGLGTAALKLTFTNLMLDAAAGSPFVVFAIVAFYLFVLFGLGAIKLYFLDRGVWAAAVNSVSVFNLGTLAAAAARGTPADSVGEGLADALDFSGGI